MEQLIAIPPDLAEMGLNPILPTIGDNMVGTNIAQKTQLYTLIIQKEGRKLLSAQEVEMAVKVPIFN